MAGGGNGLGFASVAGFGINIAELMLLLLHVYLAVLGEE
jgi:hypothetical protein